MSPLSSIPGIGKTSLELLEVAGIQDVRSLAKAGVAELLQELERANDILHIAKRVPSASHIRKWISAAREEIGQEVEESASEMPVNYEGNPQVLEMIKAAPAAIPFSGRQLVEHGVGVGDIPPAVFLNRYAGDLEVRVSGMSPVEETQPGIPESKGRERKPRREAVHPTGGAPVGIDLSRLRSTAEFTAEGLRLPAVTATDRADRLAVLRAPLESTNRGKTPDSRAYIRGVLYSHPVSLWFAALVTLLVIIVFPAAVVSSGLLLASVQTPASFLWVPRWLIAFPIALPVLGIAYFALGGYSTSCGICRQRLFWPRNCIKNSKAHRLYCLGFIIPLCLHILVFRWFRCCYCGTPVRLKK